MTDKTALIVIDMQEDYMRPGNYPDTLIDRINGKITAASQRNQMVVYGKNKGKKHKLSYVSDFVPELLIVPGLIIEKGRSSMFDGDLLLSSLNERKISEIEVTGIDGNFCVAASTLDAAALGFSVYYPLDCIGIKNQRRFLNTKKKLESAKITIT